ERDARSGRLEPAEVIALPLVVAPDAGRGELERFPHFGRERRERFLAAVVAEEQALRAPPFEAFDEADDGRVAFTPHVRHDRAHGRLDPIEVGLSAARELREPFLEARGA